jgi:hypothetical protein
MRWWWAPICLIAGGAIAWASLTYFGPGLPFAAASEPQPLSPQAKEAVARAVANRGPKVRMHDIGQGDLIEIDVPQWRGGSRVQVVSCIVWRDAITKTSSISCPGEPTQVRPEAFE